MIWVFDAYGTLFDVDGAARAAAAEDPALAAVWPRLSADWRRKQLEYSWLRAITGDHADFWQVTSDALDWAAERHGASREQAARLLDLYRRLPAYPEVPAMLDRLRAAGGSTAASSPSGATLRSNSNPRRIRLGPRVASLTTLGPSWRRHAMATARLPQHCRSALAVF